MSKMQVNTKEILLNHPSKGLAQCAMQCTAIIEFMDSCSGWVSAVILRDGVAIVEMELVRLLTLLIKWN